MRKLSLKSYLEKQMVTLSGLNSKSLYRSSAMSEKNARLKDTVVLYLMLFVRDDLKRHLLNKYPYLSSGCEKLTGITQENAERFLEDDSLSEYRTIYENYLNTIGTHDNENRIKRMMYQRIVQLQAEKGISNYAVYKALKLNPGNANAFLKNADVSKLSLDTVRRILEFVNQYRSPESAA